MGDYQHWAPDEPDGVETDLCAYITVGDDYHLSGFWEDTSCSTPDTFYAICEIPAAECL